jgi:hypothetical protein
METKKQDKATEEEAAQDAKKPRREKWMRRIAKLIAWISTTWGFLMLVAYPVLIGIAASQYAREGLSRTVQLLLILGLAESYAIRLMASATMRVMAKRNATLTARLMLSTEVMDAIQGRVGELAQQAKKLEQSQAAAVDKANGRLQ